MPKEDGDMPRQVDTDAEPVMSHNEYPLNEAHWSSGVEAAPRSPGVGSTDDEQILGMRQPETAYPPMGPDTLSGGTIMEQPVPPVPDGIHDPTSAPSGAFGAAEDWRGREKDDEAG